MSARVSTAEVLELTIQARELSSLGSSVELDDRIRFYDHKIDVLERILQHGAIEVDARITEGALAHARSMRDQYVELMITGA
jgi:hypothetical protein